MFNRLKQARFNVEMPQIVLWLKTGIHFSTLSRIERGYLNPKQKQKTILAKALGVKEEWLFPQEKGLSQQVEGGSGSDLPIRRAKLMRSNYVRKTRSKGLCR